MAFEAMTGGALEERNREIVRVLRVLLMIEKKLRAIDDAGAVIRACQTKREAQDVRLDVVGLQRVRERHHRLDVGLAFFLAAASARFQEGIRNGHIYGGHVCRGKERDQPLGLQIAVKRWMKLHANRQRGSARGIQPCVQIRARAARGQENIEESVLLETREVVGRVVAIDP